MKLTHRWVFRDGTTPSDSSAPLQWPSLPIELPEGEDLTVDCTAVGQNGTAYNLTGGAAPALTIKSSPADTSPVLALASTVLDPVAGTFRFVIARGVVPKGSYKWDGYFIDAGNKAWRGLLTSSYVVTDGASDVAGPVSQPAPGSSLRTAYTRGVLTFTGAGADFQDVNLAAYALSAGGYSVQLTVYNAEAGTPVDARVCPRAGDPAYPAGPPAGGFRVKLNAPADCKVLYVVEAL